MVKSPVVSTMSWRECGTPFHAKAALTFQEPFRIRIEQKHPPQSRFVQDLVLRLLAPSMSRREEEVMSAARMIPLNSRGSSNSSDDQQVFGEEKLVAAAQIGHTAAFDELCRRHADKILHIAHRITRNCEDAEDVVQESFLKAFIHLKSFDGRSRFSTWLTRIAINSALMSLRKNRRSREIPLEESIESSEPRCREFADPALNPERLLAEHERETILRNAIAKLRPRIREAIEIHQLQERSLEDTAKALGISLAAAKGRLFQARVVIRRRLKSAVPCSGTRKQGRGPIGS
jgi:RNA polymerase sigma-70 factor, ECF subfamily